MVLTLKRVAKRPTYTIGKLYIDGVYFCDTLEDRDRGLTQSMSLKEIQSKKVPSQTAIPTGTYEVSVSVVSPRFSKKAVYQKICKGRVPRLLNVPGYDGVLIHIGNTDKDSAGCILVGKNSAVGKVLQSTDTFTRLFAKLNEADKNNEKITITVQ